jgi:hypothetical protein
MSPAQTTQLENLGISLPPPRAFGVDLSEKEKDILLLWAVSQLAEPRAVRSSKMVGVSVGAVAADILPASEDYRPFAIQNNSDTLNLWICFGLTATTVVGIKIPPNGYYESPFDFRERVSAISTGALAATMIVSVR